MVLLALLVLYLLGPRVSVEEIVLRDPPEKVAREVVDRFGKGHDDAACIALRFDA